ncbi:MAG TPA: ABC transporter ATP-binding protein [archaeon]|nr:ABC transporter ATP-binding protein [archaeon]
MKIIESHGVIKDFKGVFRGKLRALDRVDMAVGEGEIFGLLGPNGAGKTTLIKILLGLIYPTRGYATVSGVDVKDFRSRQKVGYLPENPYYPQYLNGSQVVRLFGKLGALGGVQLKERTAELLRKMKIDQWAEMKVKNYSKGMAQRLGLAQALINDPQIIFLDEPTDGLDPIGRQETRSVLIELRKAGKTVFLNSHLLSEVEMVCDRVAILDKGRLLAEGRLDELTSEANRFRIKCREIGPELEKAIEALTLSKKIDDGWLEITVETAGQLNQVIDSIRKAGLLIESIQPVKRSLESYFIDLIKDIRGEGESK